ncbi:MAG: chemotaxis protein CheW [Gemmatimonadales bacterium]|nr:chemotaxis protein CheW [Gemmatimonadales bacterium]
MHDDDLIQLVTFRVGPQEFAVDILQLQRILRYERPAPLPDAPSFLEGVVAHDGVAVPVVDLRTRLGYPAVLTDDTRLMVLDLDGQRVAVVVDAAREILRVDSRAIAAPPPMVRGLAAKYIAGIHARADRTIVILNATRILSATERGALRDLEAAT